MGWLLLFRLRKTKAGAGDKTKASDSAAVALSVAGQARNT